MARKSAKQINTSERAYIRAYGRQDHRRCAFIANLLRQRGAVIKSTPFYDNRDDFEKDCDDEIQRGWGERGNKI